MFHTTLCGTPGVQTLEWMVICISRLEETSVVSICCTIIGSVTVIVGVVNVSVNSEIVM